MFISTARIAAILSDNELYLIIQTPLCRNYYRSYCKFIFTKLGCTHGPRCSGIELNDP